MTRLSGTIARTRRRAAWSTAVGAAAVLATLPLAQATSVAAPASRAQATQNAFRQVNLVSDIPGLAQLTDRQVKNPWGIAFGPDTPLWVSNNFNPAFDENNPRPQDLLTKITVYSGANGQQPITKVPLEVTASAPTGIVFNPTTSFVISRGGASAPSRFLWTDLTFQPTPNDLIGRVTGWSPDVPPLSRGVVKVRQPGALYFGITIARTTHGPRLLTANGLGGIDVYDSRFRKVNQPGAFVDPHGANLAPYNVAVLGGRVFVSYVPASPQGTTNAVSVFTQEGKFVKRLVTGAPLAGPWGMAIAPANWGTFGGDLLVGNVDDGRINAFDPSTGRFEGVLRDAQGKALVNLGLWGIAFGNGVIGTPRTLLFSAGIGNERSQNVYEHGLVGSIRPIGG